MPLTNALPLVHPLRLPAERQSARPGHAGALYDLDFAGGLADATALSNAGFTFARSGTAWSEDGTAFASGVPRITSAGLMIEGARTNGVPNNTYVNGAIGAHPTGTLGTDWFVYTVTGVTITIVALGNDGNRPYADIRFHGTNSSGSTGYLGCSIGWIACSAAQVWTASAHLSLVAGALPASGFTLVLSQFDGADAYQDGTSAAIAPTASTARVSVTRTLTTGAARIGGGIQLELANAAACDFTVRLSFMQIEQGGWPSSPIKTANAGAVTRNAESCIATRSAVPSGSAVLELTTAPGADGTSNQMLYSVEIDSNNRYSVYRSTANGCAQFMGLAGVTQVASNTGSSTLSSSQTVKMACRWASNNTRMVMNALSAGSDTSCTTAGYTKECLGTRSTGADAMYGYIRRARRYARPLTNVELAAATT